MTHRAFELLDSKIQQAVWDLRWNELRPIQVDAINALLTTKAQIILAAATASGKTEAAFLPILSRLADSPKPSIQAIYVSPLKALINDQFRRLEELCARAQIPVHKWHGDVSASKKRRMRENPRGVLLITPESLESNFINYGSKLPKIYAHLDFVVIDELHSFLDDVRGIHLQSLIARLRAATGRDPRMLGLSATLADFAPARHYLSPEDPGNVEVICDAESEREVKVGVRSFLEDKPNEVGSVGQAGPASQDTTVWDDVAGELARSFGSKSGLVFTNSRRLAEILADRLHQIAGREHWPRNPFFVHHGSLSRELREDVESRLKSGDPVTALCTSTLEMGIDIGSVSAVGQIGPPWSVSSLVQRLGRSGRQEGEAAVLRLYAVDDRTEPGSSIEDRLYPKLVRSIALIELMISRWLEPVDRSQWHLSTCIHQVLSVLRQTGGIRADRLFAQLCVDGPFQKVDAKSFDALLTHLGKQEIIEQMPTGELILAPLGERTVESHEFYAAFVGNTELSIQYDSAEIGTLPADQIPPVEQHIILGGRRWRVEDIDLSQLRVYVRPSRGGAPPTFGGTGGEIHGRIIQEMRQVLSSKSRYRYLLPDANASLNKARREFSDADLGTRRILVASNRVEWFPWVGTRAMATIGLAARLAGLKPNIGLLSIQFNMANEGQVREFLQNLSHGGYEPLELATELPVKEQHRFDQWAPPGVLDRANSESRIDLQSAESAAEEALRELR